MYYASSGLLAIIETTNTHQPFHSRFVLCVSNNLPSSNDFFNPYFFLLQQDNYNFLIKVFHIALSVAFIKLLLTCLNTFH